MGGNAQARRIGGDLSLGQIGGSLRLAEAAGAVTAGTVGGDVLLEETQGEVQVEQVNGGATVVRATGAVRMPGINGEARLIDCSGALTVQSAGSIYYAGAPRAEATARLQTEGQALLALDPAANVALNLQAGAEIDVALPLQDEQREGGQVQGRLGDGSAHLDVTAGGRIGVVPRDPATAETVDRERASANGGWGGQWGPWNPGAWAAAWSSVGDPEAWGQRYAHHFQRRYEHMAERVARRAAQEAERATRCLLYTSDAADE